MSNGHDSDKENIDPLKTPPPRVSEQSVEDESDESEEDENDQVEEDENDQVEEDENDQVEEDENDQVENVLSAEDAWILRRSDDSFEDIISVLEAGIFNWRSLTEPLTINWNFDNNEPTATDFQEPTEETQMGDHDEDVRVPLTNRTVTDDDSMNMEVEPISSTMIGLEHLDENNQEYTTGEQFPNAQDAENSSESPPSKRRRCDLETNEQSTSGLQLSQHLSAELTTQCSVQVSPKQQKDDSFKSNSSQEKRRISDEL
ncbi:hypothetical protein M3Y98_00468800 [Aphelenchoides besseyi]|nr:hypothetical protein M3Y98_00468800 [Aphelenchoides besseyi]